MKIRDYDGPTGRYIATGERIIPLDSAEGIAALGHSAMLSSLGTGPDADRYQQGMQRALDEARRLDLEVADSRSDHRDVPSKIFEKTREAVAAGDLDAVTEITKRGVQPLIDATVERYSKL